MNTWKVLLATLVIFTAGIVTGGLLGKRCTGAIKPTSGETAPVVDAGTHGTNRIEAPAQIPGMRKDFVKRLDRELHLTPEQRERIDKIMAEGQEHIKELWDQIAPQCSAQWKVTQERIREELTEEQKVQFVEFMKNPRKKYPTNAPPEKVSAAITNAAAKPQ